MGKVKDTCIQYAAAGYQHVGRGVCGLPVLNVKYACTPPYFCIEPMDHNNASNEEAQNVCQLDNVNTVIGALFPCKITTVFRPVAISCAAALLFAKIFHPRTTAEHVCIFIFKYLFYLYLNSLTANFRSFISMSSLFCIDDVMTNAQNPVKISNLWAECPYWGFGSLTGIPPHIVTYVNQERIIKKMDDGFTRFTTVMQEDLDRRQIGGGNLSMEILQERNGLVC